MEGLSPDEQHGFDCLREFWLKHRLSPVIKELQTAMNQRSRSKVQAILDSLREKGYVTWDSAKARSYQSLVGLIPLRGVIQAGQVMEHVTDSLEYIDLPGANYKIEDYALRVCGDSMIDAHICDGDIVILRPYQDAAMLKRDTIAAVWVAGEGATLKYVEVGRTWVKLIPANPNYPVRSVAIDQVEIQGMVVGIHREYGS